MNVPSSTSIWRDQKGVSITELALVLPILILLVTASADVALAFGAKVALQQASARTVEKATAGGLNSAAFKILEAEGANAAGVSQSQVAVDKWLECDGLRQIDFNVECTDSQQVGRYVSIAIASKYTPIFSVFNWNTDPDGTIPLNAKSSVRVQ